MDGIFNTLPVRTIFGINIGKGDNTEIILNDEAYALMQSCTYTEEYADVITAFSELRLAFLAHGVKL